MATTKISELNPLLSSDIAGNDVLPIVDTDGNETKKASITALQIPIVSTGIGNCVEAVQTNSTCTQIIFGGKNNCVDASGSATTNSGYGNPPGINTCSGYNFIVKKAKRKSCCQFLLWYCLTPLTHFLVGKIFKITSCPFPFSTHSRLMLKSHKYSCACTYR